MPFVVFGLYLLLRGLRTGERPCFALAGILSAAATLRYYSGRVAPVLVAGVLAHLALRDRGLLRRRAAGLTVAVASALLTLGPMLVFFAQRPEELNARHHDVSIFNPRVAEHLKDAYHLTSVPQVIARQAVRSALTFNHTADTSQQFGSPWPLLGPWLAPFAALGLAACLGRLAPVRSPTPTPTACRGRSSGTRSPPRAPETAPDPAPDRPLPDRAAVRRSRPRRPPPYGTAKIRSSRSL